MLKIIKISDAIELVLCFEECGYQEVLDSFPSASMVRIATFNISGSDNTLLQMVEDLEPGVDVKIISNIPNRFQSYFNSRVRDRAKKNIDVYLDKLNPDNYTADVATFFNFDNHSKIIMTDAVAYIGSANFSSESSRNFECGVLIKDRAIIEQIEREFLGAIQDDSVEFRGNEIARIYVHACEILSRLELITTTIRWSMYVEMDLPFRGIQYKSFSPELSSIDLSELETVIEDLEQFLLSLEMDEKYDEFTRINSELLSSVRDLITIDGPIYLLADFDEQKYAEDYLEEHSLWADEDNLDRFANRASEEAGARHTELALEAESEIEILLSTLSCLIEDTAKLISSIGDCDKKAEIDNT